MVNPLTNENSTLRENETLTTSNQKPTEDPTEPQMTNRPKPKWMYEDGTHGPNRRNKNIRTKHRRDNKHKKTK